MKRVLITEDVAAPLDLLDGLQVDIRDGLWRNRTELLAHIKDYDGLIVRNYTAVDRELIEGAPLLRVVGRLGAGLDNLDLGALQERSISVISAPGLNARAVAEYVLGACLNLARRLAYSDRETRAGSWARHVGIELTGRQAGIIGLGATGAATAHLLRTVGMDVAGYDPYLPAPPDVQVLPLDALLGRSHVISIHVPLNDATRGMIGSPQMALLPPRALVINAARGGVLDESALLTALESGHLGGAALDVRRTEPPVRPDPFATRDDVLLTAHLAGLTEESMSAIAQHVLSGVRRALS